MNTHLPKCQLSILFFISRIMAILNRASILRHTFCLNVPPIVQNFMSDGPFPRIGSINIVNLSMDDFESVPTLMDVRKGVSSPMTYFD